LHCFTSKKEKTILFMGLDNAGKTTLISALKGIRFVQHVPTLHSHCERLSINGFTFRTFDFGGPEGVRRIRRDYFAEADGVVFLVDTADRTRFQEVAEDLSELLNVKALSQAPFLVLGNKGDVPNAASEDELRYALGLHQHPTFGRNLCNQSTGARPIELFMCSVVKRAGYAEGFRWLRKALK